MLLRLYPQLSADEMYEVKFFTRSSYLAQHCVILFILSVPTAAIDTSGGLRD